MIWSKAPSISPDLNPIEKLWEDMKKFISSKLCKNMRELKMAILKSFKTSFLKSSKDKTSAVLVLLIILYCYVTNLNKKTKHVSGLDIFMSNE